MKIEKSLVALVLVIILGVVTYQFVYKPDQEKLIRETKERFLVQFDPNKIVGFTIGRPDSSMIIEKGLGRIWNIIRPVTAEAENQEIYTLFRTLRDSQIQYVVDEKPKNLANFGLAGAPFYLAMSYEDGKSDTLYSGFNTPDGTMTYVKFASGNRVVTIDRAFDDFLKLPQRSYRSRTLLNISESDITALELIRGENDVINLERTGAGWQMNQPWSFAGNETNISELMTYLVENPKEHFVAEHADSLSQYGLDNPSYIVRVSFQPGIPDKILLVGKEFVDASSSGQFWFAKQFDKDLIFTIANAPVTDFARLPIWFVNQFPMVFNQETANRITIDAPGNNLVFVRGSQGFWSLVSPMDKNVDQKTIGDILSITRFLVFQDVYAYEPTPEDIKKAGLEKPQITIAFYQNDTLIDRVEFGNSFTERELNTYCRTSARPIIYITRSTVNTTMNQVLETVFEK